ncbi:MAG TPA: type II toxin-antitoxin system HicB family antitoxin [bacterium]|jgi:predicted RNase H-like HicB family nuclease|nr:type II toxin-antitoxin system HicB family antitoxin [bacterium]
MYVAECLEVAVVTQGHTLDELLANLREALALHLEGEEAALLGLVANPRLVMTYETPLAVDGAGP